MKKALFIFLSLAIAACSKSTYHDYIKKGIAAQKDKEYKTAIEYYTKSIALREKNQVAYNNRGMCYKKLNMPNKALADFKKAIKHYRLFAEAYSNAGDIYMERKDYATAEKYFKKSVKNELHNNIVGHYNLACAYSMQNRKEEALSHLEKAGHLIMRTGKLAKKLYTYMQTDKHLEPIRKEKRFIALQKKLKEFL